MSTTLGRYVASGLRTAGAPRYRPRAGTLDLADQVVARRQPLLIDHRLQALDVRPCRLLERGRGIEPGPELPRLLRRARPSAVSPEVSPSAWTSCHGRRRVRARRRSAGPARSSRPPGCRPRPSPSRGPRSRPPGPAATRPGPAGCRRAAGRTRTSVPRIGTARVCGTAAGIAPRLIHSTDAERAGARSSDVVRESRASGIRLGAGEHEDVPFPEPPRRIVELRPAEFREPAVHDLEGRATRAVIEHRVGVERRDDRPRRRATCSSALVAALPASTQPSKAAMSTGAIRSPGSPGLPGPASE